MASTKVRVVFLVDPKRYKRWHRRSRKDSLTLSEWIRLSLDFAWRET